MPGGISSRAGGALVALAVFTFWITWQAKTLEGGLLQPATTAFFGKPAPDFALLTLDGRQVTLAEFRGKKNVVISFWASWCGPCRLELPALSAFYKKAREQRDDFEIIAINTDDEREDAERAAKEMQLPFPVVLDPQNATASAYGVAALPTLMIVDKAGILSFGTMGFNPALASILAANLGMDQRPPVKGPDAGAGH